MIKMHFEPAGYSFFLLATKKNMHYNVYIMILLIVACAKNNVIGKDGRIPWDLPQDRQNFKKLTSGNVVIMGRRTFEEIFVKFGRGLPDRETIVVSKNHDFNGEQLCTARSLEDAIAFAKKQFPSKDIFICGGESIYREAISKKLVEKMYITKVDQEIEGDTFFPQFDEKEFDITYFDKGC